MSAKVEAVVGAILAIISGAAIELSKQPCDAMWWVSLIFAFTAGCLVTGAVDRARRGK